MLNRQLLAAALVTLATASQAQTAPATADHSAHHPPAASATAAAGPKTEGEVRKIDKAQGKVTLKHGPIQNLDMPPMTMVFRVSDGKLLEGLKEGDKVRFTAEQVNGVTTVTAIEAAAR